ncbi:exonuclease domain-containing protein [Micromonospora aurantiaca (nom. illeg.)]|uniref:exonuclease domain-containing protein n=1 Tax=Micromonospora aurantiaca (nom. illeg.) TaxID=47850 RepID=UPI003EBC74EE
MSQVGLFAYGSAGGREGVDLGEVPFVVVDVETTGLSPTSDRIVEIALVRIEGGRAVDEWATLVDPGRDPGPTFVHHITTDMVSGAPTFADVAGEILSRLDGAVAVAHNARFEEGFIAQEFARVGISTAPLPAVCTLRLARQVMAAPNFQLVSCCSVYGIELHDAHTALGDTRATAQLLPRLLAHAPALRFPSAPVPLPRYPRHAQPRTRVTGLRKGADGWIQSLLGKLPYSTGDADPASAEAYLAAVGSVLSDGKLTGVEAKALARLAGQSGMGAQQVRVLHHRYLDGLRDAALSDDILTSIEHRQLVTAAQLLGEPDYFADLTAPETLTTDRTQVAKQKGQRVWCSPSVSADVRDRLTQAGFVLALNLTRNVVTAVVAAADQDNAKVARAHELAIPIRSDLTLDDMLGAAATPSLASQQTSSTTAAVGAEGTGPRTVPTPTAAVHVPTQRLPQVIAGWYLDPSGRWTYRFWDGQSWTEKVSGGDGRTWSDSTSLPLWCAPTTDGLVDGRQPHTLTDQIMTMQRNDIHAALLLTVRCIDAVENDSRINGYGVAPWYYERAAIIFARLGDPAAEVAVLERFARQRHAPGAKPPQLLDRLRRLHEATTGA